jgi:mannose/fructose/N-acetylgalactosamine-specific phosphotransferase system component IIB
VALALIRVDDRLLHGQVAVGWADALGTKLIVVANDEVAGDDLLRRLYAGAGPPGVGVSVLPLKEIAQQIEGMAACPDSVIIVVKRPADLVELVELGCRFTEVNIGGMHYEDGKQKLLPYMYVGDGDVRDLRCLLGHGIEVAAQDVPGARRYDVRSLLDELA